jgi:hypothetical protein
VFPVMYELNYYINLLRNSVFRGLKCNRNQHCPFPVYYTSIFSYCFDFIRNRGTLNHVPLLHGSDVPSCPSFLVSSEGNTLMNSEGICMQHHILFVSIQPRVPHKCFRVTGQRTMR